MDIESVAVPVVVTLVSTALSVGVTWGILKTEVTALKEKTQALEKKIENDCVGREGCRLRHEYIDRDMDEIKETLSTIKEGQERQMTLLLKLVDANE